MKSLLTAILLSSITILNYAQETSRPDELIPNAGYEAYQDPNGEPVYKRSVIKAYGGAYDNNGLIYSDSVLFNSKGDLLFKFLNGNKKYAYSYNEKGLKTTDEVFTKSGAGWNLSYKNQYFYNSEGLLDYTYMNGTKYQYYYSNAGLIDSILSSWTKEYYKNGKRISRARISGAFYEKQEWDENGRLTLDGSGWTNEGSSKSNIYAYDSLGRVIKYTLAYWGKYTVSYVTEYSYIENSLGKTIFRLSHILPTTFLGGSPEGFERNTYEYTQNGDVLSDIYEKRADTLSEWKPYRKDEYTYNELGQLIKYQIYDYDSSGVWINSIYGISAIIPGTDVEERITRIEYAYTRIDTIIGINDREELTPAKFSLAQNYPNPFNPETKISFSLPASGKTSLKVYDMLGREVAELINGEMEKGPHSVNFNGRSLSSGVYIYRLQSGNFTESKKMALLK